MRRHSFDLSSICSTPVDPSLSYDNYEPRASRTAGAPLTPSEETTLLQRLCEGTHKSPDAARLLRKAQTANRIAYKTWKKRQAKKNPATHRLLVQTGDPIEATTALRDRPGAMKGLLNAMPFPEVLLLTTEDDVLIHTGKTAIIIARLQLLHRVSTKVDGSKVTFCREWAAAIHAASSLEAKWTLVNDIARWKKLSTIANQLALRLPQRSQPGLVEAEWCRLIAYVLLLPECLPHEFGSRDIPQQCDALMVWMANSSNTLSVVAAGQAVARRKWEAAFTVFSDWADRRSGPSLFQFGVKPTGTAPRRY